MPASPEPVEDDGHDQLIRPSDTDRSGAAAPQPAPQKPEPSVTTGLAEGGGDTAGALSGARVPATEHVSQRTAGSVGFSKLGRPAISSTGSPCAPPPIQHDATGGQEIDSQHSLEPLPPAPEPAGRLLEVVRKALVAAGEEWSRVPAWLPPLLADFPDCLTQPGNKGVQTGSHDNH